MEEFSGRKFSDFHREHRFFNNKPQGIINTEGKHWSTQRRFSMKTLKDFGFGKQSLEETINEECRELIENLLSQSSENNHEDILLSSEFNIPVINILWQMVAASRITKEDLAGMAVVASVNDQFKHGVKISMLPLALMKVFPKLTSYQMRIDIYDIQKDYILKEIKRHEETFEPSHMRDFIDVYLAELRAGPQDGSFTQEDLTITMMDFLQAGSETSSTTLKWLVLYWTLNQEVQERCRSELSSVLGGAQCTVTDMARLPFLTATIAEVQRLACVAPVSLAHKESH